MRRLVLLLLATSITAKAQTWVKVATESQTTSVILPVGTTYRFGASLPASTPNCGTLGFLTSTAPTDNFTLTVYRTSFVCDPAPNPTKELDILQTSSSQTIKLTVNGKTSSLTISAQSTGKPPSLVATYACTVNLYSDGTFTSTLCTKVGK